MSMPLTERSGWPGPSDIPTAAVTAVLEERQRCIMLLRRRARFYEQRKLFPLSRALAEIAQEIDAQPSADESS